MDDDNKEALDLAESGDRNLSKERPTDGNPWAAVAFQALVTLGKIVQAIANPWNVAIISTLVALIVMRMKRENINGDFIAKVIRELGVVASSSGLTIIFAILLCFCAIGCVVLANAYHRRAKKQGQVNARSLEAQRVKNFSATEMKNQRVSAKRKAPRDGN